MYSLLVGLASLAFLITVTVISYRLGQTKTDNPQKAAIIGFFTAFFPPLALIYLIVLLLKEDASVV